MEASPKQKRKWLVEFALISLVPIVLLGVVIGQSLRSSVRNAALEDARHQAELVSKLGFSDGLKPDELLRPLPEGRLQTLDRALEGAPSGSEIERATIRNRDRQVIYSDARARLGRVDPPSEELTLALAGNIVMRVAEPGAPGGPTATVLKVFVPLNFASAPVVPAVAELWLPYAPIQASINRNTRKLYPYLVGGLLILYLTLLAVVAWASERLRRRAADKEQEALRDALTGLPNRPLFHELVARALAASKRKERMVAVMLMDLDRFKEVNDTLGHHNGDLLLQRIASRFQGVLRDSETVARLGGDEFAIVLTDIRGRAAVVQVAKRVLKTLEEPVAVGGLALRVEASIGIALSPDHGKEVDSLLRSADVAMYAAKGNHSGYEFYAAEQHRYDAGRLALVGELRRAIDKSELVFYYQPKVDLQTGMIGGVEALARWEHPTRGLLSPDEFVPLAERSSLLRPITLHLIDTALAQCSAWKTKGFDLSVAVNLSTQNLLDLQLPTDLGSLLDSWRLAPGSLDFEITESTIMTDPRRAMSVLTRLHKLGVKLSVDDFGTGYSSLAYLKQLPVSALKIDKSFVMSMTEEEDNAVIVQSTVDLGHNLGLEVVAEGVEDESTYGQLAALGCDYAQGYFLSKPLPPNKMTVWLEVFCRPWSKDGEPAKETPTDQLKEWVVG